MAIDTTVSGWLDELRHAGKTINEYTSTLQDDKHAFVGPAYREGWGKKNPENHALEWFSLMRAQCLLGNPRVRFTSDSPDNATQMRALALTHACNAWSQRTQMRNLNEELLMDYGFKWAVCLVTSEPQPGYYDTDNVPYWPAAYRIPTGWFRYDTTARRAQRRRWSAHLNISDRETLLELAKDEKSGWKADQIELIAKQNVRKFRENDNSSPDRDEIAYWEIHAPDIELDNSPGKDKGYFGTIFTVVDDQSDAMGYVRDPFPYFGPPQGPYVAGGDYVIPDESAPMGPLTATKFQAEYVNRIARAGIRGVEKYKRLVLVRNGGNLPDLIKDGQDQFVFSIDDKDVRSAVNQVEIGGITEQYIAAKQDAQGTLDRNSGITDLMRGKVDPSNTATADALANQSGQTRTSYTVAKFRAFVTQIMWHVGYFIDRDEDIEMQVPESAGLKDAQGRPSTLVQGGIGKDQKPEEFFGHNLGLEVGSMERDLQMDVQVRQAILNNKIQQIAALGPIASLFINWQKNLDDEAEMTGVRELRDIINVPMLQALGMMQIQQQGQQPPGDAPKTPQPTFSRTVNTKGTTLPQSMAARGDGKPLTPKPVLATKMATK